MSSTLLSIKNKYIGKDVYILGSAPSILEHDLEKLNDKYSIGVNSSTLLEEKFHFTSTFYTVSDARFLTHPQKRAWGTTALNSQTIRIISKELKQHDDFTLANTTHYISPLNRDGFSKDLTLGFYFGCTTIMLAIQLAYFAGFQNVYLLGCDMRYPPESPRFYAENIKQLEDSFTGIQLHNIINAAMTMEHEGRNIFISNEKSLLYSYLPYRKTL